MISARTVYFAYPESDLVPVDPPRHGESMCSYYQRIAPHLEGAGDTLFAFLMRELGSADLDADEAVKRMAKAKEDLATVAHILARSDRVSVDALATPESDEAGAIEQDAANQSRKTHSSTVAALRNQGLGK